MKRAGKWAAPPLALLMLLGATRARSQDPQPPPRPFGALVAAEARQNENAPAAENDRVVENDLNAKPKIVGGVPAPQGKYPWVIAIGYFNGNRLVQYCGGTVVGPGWVLTAAHCTLKKDDVIAANVVSLAGVHAPSALIKGVFRGPFVASTRTEDYALVRLNRDLGIKKITLNRDPSIEIRKNTPLTILGWGRTSEDANSSEFLLQADLKTIDFEQCGNNYRMAYLPLTQTMFCAAAKKRDACYGDSGGPAFRALTTNPVTYQLLGIISWGKDCGQMDYPGVYTRTSGIATWVDDTVKKCPAAPAAERDSCWNM